MANVLTDKAGPLPTWAWLAIATVAAIIYYGYQKTRSGSTSTVSPSAPAGSVPDFVIQNQYLPPTSDTPPDNDKPPAHHTPTTTHKLHKVNPGGRMRRVPVAGHHKAPAKKTADRKPAPKKRTDRRPGAGANPPKVRT